MFSKYVSRIGGATGANAEVQRVRKHSEVGELPSMKKAATVAIGSPKVSDCSDNCDRAISTGSTPPASPKCFIEDTESGEDSYGKSGEDSYVIRAGSRPVAVRGPHTQGPAAQLPGALARELLESQEMCRKDMEQLRKELGSLSNRIGMANTGAHAQAAATYAAEAGRRAQISELENRARAAESKLEAYSLRLSALEASPPFAETLPRSKLETPHWGLDSGTPKEPGSPPWAGKLVEAATPAEIEPPALVVSPSVEAELAVSAPQAVSAAASAPAAASATGAAALAPPATSVSPVDMLAAVAELAGPFVAAAVARLATEIREELTSSILFFQDQVEKRMTALENGLDAVRTVSRKSSWNAGWRAGQLEQYARRVAPHEAVNHLTSSGVNLYARHCDESLEHDRHSSVPTMSPMMSPTMSRTSIKASAASSPPKFLTSRPDDWSEVGLEVATERKRECLR